MSNGRSLDREENLAILEGVNMTEKYEFPEELRLITDEPIEDDGWGEFSLDSKERKAEIVVRNMAEFVIYHHCLLSPTLDVDRHIAALVKKLECPVGSERDVFMCPCRKVEGEIEKDGHTSCGIFVTERQVQQVNQLQSSKEKTKGLLKRYKDLEG